MAKKLNPITALSGAKHNYDGVSVSEVSGRSIVSIACPKGGSKALGAAVKKAYKVDMPKPGNSNVSKSDNARIAWTSADQSFVIFDDQGVYPAEHVKKKTADKGYYTDQSDSWTMIQVSGPRSREALERICPVNLHPKTFKTNMIARTSMEHLGAFIICDGKDSYTLMSARSSAGSFLHAIETSVTKTL